MPEIHTKIENPFVTETSKIKENSREAPPVVAAKLKEYGVKWDGKLTLQVLNHESSLALADTTKKVTFKSGESFVEIVGRDENGSKTALLVSKGSIKMDGDELRFPTTPGEDISLAEILEQNLKYADEMAKNGAIAVADKIDFPSFK